LEELGIDGRVILRLIFKKSAREGGSKWLYVAENTDRWLALVNLVMNLWVP